MALPTVVGAGTVASGSAALTPGLPGSLANGDILILLVSNSTTSTIAATLSDAQSFSAVPSGASYSGNFGGIHVFATLFWRRYDGTGAAPTVADNGEANIARIYAFRGCEPSGNPWDEVLTDGDNDGDTTLTMAQSGNTLGADRLVASFFAGFSGGSGSAALGSWANASLSNIVEQDDQEANVATNICHLAMVTGEKASAGSYGDTTASWSGSPPYAVSAGVTLALKPAAAIVYVPPSSTPRSPSRPRSQRSSFAFVPVVAAAPVVVPPGVASLTRPAAMVRRPSQQHTRSLTIRPPTVPVVVAPLPSFLPVRVGMMPRRDPARHPRGSAVQPPRVIADAFTPPVGPAGSGTFSMFVEDEATITYEWLTDVQPARSGNELRRSILKKPRQRFDFTSLLTDSESRSLLGTLADAAVDAPTFLVGMPHEELGVVSSTSTTITVDSLAHCDWAVAGQRIVVMSPAGVQAEASINGSPSGATIPVSANLTAVAIAGARVMPAVAVYLDAEQNLGRHRVNLSRWVMSARAAVHGYGATSTLGAGATVTNYDDMPVWDRGVAQTFANQPLMTGAQLVDFGARITQLAVRSVPAWGRSVRIESDSTAEWQWFKKFLDTVRGRAIAFLLPTGRADLIPVGNASSGILRISGADYVNDWFPSLAHRRLRLVEASGNAVYRTISACVDNGDGTQDLTLNSAFGAALERVEFLETVRFEFDEVSVRWRGYGFESSPMTRVVQQ